MRGVTFLPSPAVKLMLFQRTHKTSPELDVDKLKLKPPVDYDQCEEKKYTTLLL